MTNRTWIFVTVLFVASCADTGPEPVSVGFTARGGASTFSVGDWQIELDRADVGFGPAYFCASANADTDLCATAVVELAAARTIDGLDPGAQELGELDGVTGTVRSGMYDWGVSWLLPARGPDAHAGTPGHSLRLHGTATRDLTTIELTADVDVTPIVAGEPVVRGARTEHELDGDGHRLELQVDPSAWLQQIDFDELAALGPEVELVEGDVGYSAIVIGMTSIAPARFTWTEAP